MHFYKRFLCTCEIRFKNTTYDDVLRGFVAPIELGRIHFYEHVDQRLFMSIEHRFDVEGKRVRKSECGPQDSCAPRDHNIIDSNCKQT